jgi:molybdopterin synthase catalytic subunit
MSQHKLKNIFVEGPIPPSFISDSIAAHQSKTNIGAHSIFMGQVRADSKDGAGVIAIEYTSYEEMALKQMAVIRENIFERYPLTCLHVYHSLGMSFCICFLCSSQSCNRRMFRNR